MSDPVLLVGVGFMGRAYAAVLQDLGVRFIAVGRSPSGAASFQSMTGVRAETGGVAKWLGRGGEVPKSAIIAVTTEESAKVAAEVIGAGVRRILVEKPGGATPSEINRLHSAAQAIGAEVLVGYNRRFYASVLEAERRIAAEGGPTSYHFEFTERPGDATSGKFDPVVQRHWVLANSSHVIDLAFFLGGEPERLSSEISGSLDWHPSGARFVGCGVTRQGASLSYCANWASGGRWGVEVMTAESRLILRPLEQLSVQRKGSFQIDAIDVSDDLEMRFKPGLHRQAAAFLKGTDPDRFLTLAGQAQRAQGLYRQISGEREGDNL